MGNLELPKSRASALLHAACPQLRTPLAFADHLVQTCLTTE